MSLLLRYLYKKFSLHERSLLSIILIIIFSSILFGLSWFWVSNSIIWFFQGRLFEYFEYLFSNLGKDIFRTFYPFFIWSVVYTGNNIYRKMIVQKENAERAAELALSTQLQMLRYQLNPHFLFNTLSSLRALIRNEENESAEKMITQISEFLKYTLLEAGKEKVPLSKEVNIIKYYFSIEKVRFKEQLKVEFNIDPLTEDLPIPVFLIHPLIENAVKHGMKASKSPLNITLSTKLHDNGVSIEISNSGQWIDKELNSEDGGTGLQNTIKRLQLAYPGSHSFNIFKESEEVRIQIMIFKNGKSRNG